MFQKKQQPQAIAAGVFWRTPIRALLGALLCGVAGGLFAATCGTFLALAWAAPWAFVLACGLRGVLAGLVAGATVGALSGIYHVGEPLRKALPHDLSKSRMADCKRLSASRVAFLSRSKKAGKQPPSAGVSPDYKEHLWN